MLTIYEVDTYGVYECSRNELHDSPMSCIDPETKHFKWSKLANELSVRVRKALRRDAQNWGRLQEEVADGNWREWKNFGPAALQELREWAAKYGVILKP